MTPAQFEIIVRDRVIAELKVQLKDAQDELYEEQICDRCNSVGCSLYQMSRLNLQHFLTGYRKWIDKQSSERKPLPTYAMVGMIMRKPFKAQDIDKLNDLLERVHKDGLSLNIHETESRVSIIAYNRIRHSLR